MIVQKNIKILFGLFFAVFICVFVLVVQPKTEAADPTQGITTLEDFSDMRGWEPGMRVEARTVDSPEFESMSAAQVAFNKGYLSSEFVRRWRSPQDWRSFRLLRMDIYPLLAVDKDDEPVEWNTSPTIEIASMYGNVIFEKSFRVNQGQWNTVKIDLQKLNQEDLMRVVQLKLYLPETINPGSVIFYIDNLKFISEPEPPSPATTEFIIRLPFNSSNIDNLQAYKQLESSNPGINVSFTVMNDKNIDSVLKPGGFNYYYISASSDCKTSGLFDPPFLYRDFVTISSRLSEANCKGLYMHEVLTYLSGQQDWDWQMALENFDWEWMDKMVQEARLRGKKVFWAEPSYAWKYIYEYRFRDYWFPDWKGTVIPTWSTNFVNSFDQWWSGRDYSYLISGHYGISCGENIQSWYFHDYLKDYPGKSVLYETVPIAVDRKTTQWLGGLGWQQGVRYFMVEGQDDDMNWDSEFMLGIRDFRDSIVENKVLPE
ncbi:MAG: hypothetical protein ABIA66_04395 [Candidatus Omnitrophota bacterium]